MELGEQATQDSSIEARLAKFRAEVDAELQRPLTPTAYESGVLKLADDSQRRALYAAIELARMDYEEQPEVAHFFHELNHATTQEATHIIKSTPNGVKISQILSLFDALRDSLSLEHSIPKGTKGAQRKNMLRNLLVICYVVVAFPAMIGLTWLRLLHPLLRLLGVRNHSLPVDVIQKVFARNLLAILGVRSEWEGVQNLEYKKPVFCMPSHASNYDPFITGSGALYFKFIGKKSLFRVPFFGWLMGAWGHIAIDREHRSNAIASLAAAVSTAEKWSRSVTIFPEGTRSKTGRIMDFKKGAFHAAIAANLPITPLILYGNYQLWPPRKMFGGPGNVLVRVLPKVDILPNENYNSLLARVRRTMLEHYARPIEGGQSLSGHPLLNFLFVPICYFILYLTYKGIMSL